MGREYGGGWSGQFAILITSILLRGCCLQYTNFLSLTNKELVLSAVLSLSMLWGNSETSKQRQSSQGFLTHWTHDTASAKIGGEIVGKNGVDDCISGWDWP